MIISFIWFPIDFFDWIMDGCTSPIVKTINIFGVGIPSTFVFLNNYSIIINVEKFFANRKFDDENIQFMWFCYVYQRIKVMIIRYTARKFLLNTCHLVCF